MSASEAKKVKVLFTEPEAYSDQIRNALPSNWECTFKSFSREVELVGWVNSNDYHVVFGRLGLTFGSSFFKASSAIKIVATPTTGLDHIDLDAAEKAGVRILSLRGELELLEQITSTAEHAWALLLACNRQIIPLIDRTRAKSWSRSDLELHQISGQTIGIIGFGRLGKMLMDYSLAFRMHILVHDPYVPKNNFPTNVKNVPLDYLLSNSDHVVLSATYLPGDPIIIGREQTFIMKPGSTFINVSRGELVDHTALIEALDAGIIRALGVDVLPGDSRWTSHEKVQSPLIQKSIQSDRVLITPHVGGYACEAVETTRLFMVRRVNQVLNDGEGNVP